MKEATENPETKRGWQCNKCGYIGVERDGKVCPKCYEAAMSFGPIIAQKSAEEKAAAKAKAERAEEEYCKREKDMYRRMVESGFEPGDFE